MLSRYLGIRIMMKMNNPYLPKESIILYYQIWGL